MCKYSPALLFTCFTNIPPGISRENKNGKTEIQKIFQGDLIDADHLTSTVGCRSYGRERERERIRCISNKKWSRNNSSINELDTSSSSKAKANKKGKKKEKQERCVGDHRRTTTATPRSRRSHSIGRSPSIRPPWGLVWYSLVVVVVVAVVNDSFFCLDFFLLLLVVVIPVGLGFRPV